MLASTAVENFCCVAFTRILLDQLWSDEEQNVARQRQESFPGAALPSCTSLTLVSLKRVFCQRNFFYELYFGILSLQIEKFLRGICIRVRHTHTYTHIPQLLAIIKVNTSCSLKFNLQSSLLRASSQDRPNSSYPHLVACAVPHQS